MRNIEEIERERLALQRECDIAKTQKERNALGQFATPPGLARQIMRYARTFFPNREIVRFLDPAFGTGSFYSALLECFPNECIGAATGVEVDRHYAEGAINVWRDSSLDLRIADFTREKPPLATNGFNLIVCNPPYVRHHHLSRSEKARLQKVTSATTGSASSGLTGLYCYFLLLADAWAADRGICIWLIPSEFMDVNYGTILKEYLQTKVTLLRVHRFQAEDVQFNDALVSSSVVCFRKCPPPKDHAIAFTFGGSLDKPSVIRQVAVSELRPASKWNLAQLHPEEASPAARLADFFDIKRGLATGDNDFFILSKQTIAEYQLPLEFMKPILPSPRYLERNEVECDDRGHPLVEPSLFLLDCSLPEEQVRADYPNLWRYLASGQRDTATGYLCKSRSPWYSQEHRPPAMFLCTYMGRRNRADGPAFRFILNHSQATAANVYLLLYPKPAVLDAVRSKPDVSRQIWNWLNDLPPELLVGGGRVYGGGLHKVEPKELGNIPADGLSKLLKIRPTERWPQLDFFQTVLDFPRGVADDSTNDRTS